TFYFFRHLFPSPRRHRDLPNRSSSKIRGRADYPSPPKCSPVPTRLVSIRRDIRRSIVFPDQIRDTPDRPPNDKYSRGVRPGRTRPRRSSSIRLLRLGSVPGFVREIDGRFPDHRLRQRRDLRRGSTVRPPHRNRRSKIPGSGCRSWRSCSRLDSSTIRERFCAIYFAAFFVFLAASRSVFLRRAARFLTLSLPRLCPIV